MTAQWLLVRFNLESSTNLLKVDISWKRFNQAFDSTPRNVSVVMTVFDEAL